LPKSLKCRENNWRQFGSPQHKKPPEGRYQEGNKKNRLIRFDSKSRKSKQAILSCIENSNVLERAGGEFCKNSNPPRFKTGSEVPIMNKNNLPLDETAINNKFIGGGK
jgi:hypothetical protein|tara:strand:+ start:345 stop:668 length:324 start_codon:yes stop_codon:yes gene_type:complete